MRIISRFHDYYDSVQAHGQDDKIRFLRRAELRPVTLPGLPWDAPALDRRGHEDGATGPLRLSGRIRHDEHSRPLFGAHVVQVGDLAVERAYLLVAGQAHAVWVNVAGLAQASDALWQEGHTAPADWALGTPLNWGDPSVRSLADRWHAHRVQERPTLAGQEVVFRRPRETDAERLTWEDLTAEGIPVARAWRAHEERHQAMLAKDWTALHLELESPLLLIKGLHRSSRSYAVLGPSENAWVLINPRLADLRWGAVQEAYTVFQAIGQFIGGVMPSGQAPMVTLQDKDLLAKHNFDKKYGFRKRPEIEGA